MKDVFGNYVMQKLFEYGDQVQKKVLANAMKSKVVDLSMQPYACRVVQKVSCLYPTWLLYPQLTWNRPLNTS